MFEILNGISVLVFNAFSVDKTSTCMTSECLRVTLIILMPGDACLG